MTLALTALIGVPKTHSQATSAGDTVAHPSVEEPSFVEIASVSNKEDANTISSLLKGRGYTVMARPDTYDHLIHIQIGPFSTRKEAETTRMRLLGDGFNASLMRPDGTPSPTAFNPSEKARSLAPPLATNPAPDKLIPLYDSHPAPFEPPTQAKVVSLPAAIPVLAVETAQTATQNSHPEKLDLAVVQQRAAAGDPAMEAELASRYRDGRGGFAKDDKLALSWLLKAAEAGNPQSQERVADAYESGRAGLKKSKKLSDEWGAKAIAAYKKLADQGDIYAERRLARLYETGSWVSKDSTQAEEYLLNAVKQGSAEAENELSFLYSSSSEYAKSCYWEQRSADDGYKWGLVGLASDYQIGFYVPKDLLVSKALVERALQQDKQNESFLKQLREVVDAIAHDPATQQRAGDRRVLGSAELSTASLELVTDRAFEGNSDAQYELGRRFERGNISELYPKPFPLMASLWYGTAAKQGNETAAAQLKRLPAQPRTNTYNAQTATREDWKAEVDRLTQEVESAEQDAVNAEALSRSYSQNGGKTSSTGTSIFDVFSIALDTGAAVKYQRDASRARQKANSLRARLDALGAQQPAEVTQSTNSTVVAMVDQSGDAYAANNVALQQQRAQLNGTVQQLNEIGAQNTAARQQAAAAGSGKSTKTYFVPLANGDTRKDTIVISQTGSELTRECFAPGSKVPYESFSMTGPSEFFMNVRNCKGSTPAPVTGGGGSAAPPALPAPQGPSTVATSSQSICPASGFIPGLMRQTGDTAQGVQCTPGQPISPNAYSSGGSGTSGSGGGSSSSGAAGGAPGRRTHLPMSNCVSTSFQNGEYGLSLAFTNQCGENVFVEFYIGPNDVGNLQKVAAGANWIAPFTSKDVARRGEVRYFACPVSYPGFATDDGRGVQFATRRYFCQTGQFDPNP